MLTGGTPVPRGMGILPMRCLSLKPDVCATRSRLNRVILVEPLINDCLQYPISNTLTCLPAQYQRMRESVNLGLCSYRFIAQGRARVRVRARARARARNTLPADENVWEVRCARRLIAHHSL